jgi:hypothetical protein
MVAPEDAILSGLSRKFGDVFSRRQAYIFRIFGQSCHKFQ